MAVILSRFADTLGVPPAGAAGAVKFPDVCKIAPWAMDAAYYCEAAGIISGRSGGTFDPQSISTRAEVSAAIERFIKSVMD